MFICLVAWLQQAQREISEQLPKCFKRLSRFGCPTSTVPIKILILLLENTPQSPPPRPQPGLRRRGAARKRRHWLGWGRHLRPTLRGSRAPPVLARCGLGPPFGCRRAPPPLGALLGTSNRRSPQRRFLDLLKTLECSPGPTRAVGWRVGAGLFADR